MPIQLEMTSHECSLLKAHEAFLYDFGFTFKRLTEQMIQIRSIPAEFPALVIKDFIFNLLKFLETHAVLTVDVVMRLFLDAEPISFEAMPRDEQQALIAYWETLDNEAYKNISVCLDVTRCREIIADG